MRRTFLELVQMAAREADLPNVPASVANQSGQALDFVNWVRDQYVELQLRHGGQWKWLRRTFTLNTVVGQESYAYSECTDVDAGAAISRFRSWRLTDPNDLPKIYRASLGVANEQRMTCLDWHAYKHIYRIGTQNNYTPIHISVDPQDKIVIGPKPDAVYVITGDFYRGAQLLENDGDYPELPNDYHDLLAWRAVYKYAVRKSAQEILLQASDEVKRLTRQLENNQLPKLVMAGPLA